MASMNEKVEVDALALSQANVQALDIVIGLMASGYPEHLTAKFIDECVTLKQDGLLDAMLWNGLNHMAEMLGDDAYKRLALYLLERAEKEASIGMAAREADAPEVELVYDPSIEKEYREEQAKKEAAVRKAAAVKKQAGGKAATVRKAATAAKKTAARKATEKKEQRGS